MPNKEVGHGPMPRKEVGRCPKKWVANKEVSQCRARRRGEKRWANDE